MRFLYPICIFFFLHFIKLTHFLKFQNIPHVLFWLTSNFSLFFYDSRLYLLCLGAFSIFFLSVKSLQLERPVRTCYTDQWSIFTSNELFEKAKGPVVLADCVAACGRREALDHFCPPHSALSWIQIDSSDLHSTPKVKIKISMCSSLKPYRDS